MGFWGMGSSADKINAELQARLAAGPPPPQDPAELHMNRVKRLLGWWFTALVVASGLVTWFDDSFTAAIVAGAMTAGALALLARFGRGRPTKAFGLN